MIYSISSGKVVKLLYGSSSNILREDPGSFEIWSEICLIRMQQDSRDEEMGSYEEMD